MPELPEVETIRRGLEPLVVGRRVTEIAVHERRLRWPVPESLAIELTGRRIRSLDRRSKYLLAGTTAGTLMIHLGMSGRLWLAAADVPRQKHDHIDIRLDSGRILRYHDPRRFGSMHWIDDVGKHPLIRSLGPEPLSPAFTGRLLYDRARGRQVAVKNFLMDSHVVVGVGNIYATESLFTAGIHPARAAGRISLARYEKLAAAVREVLENAIDAGGTTLRDFANAQGRPGYFQLELNAYGRAGKPCGNCGSALRSLRLGQRSSFYCPRCQR